MKLYDIIREGYKEVEAKFVAQGADAAQVQQALQQYRDLVNRNQVKGNERNIDWWGKTSFQDFQKFLQQKALDTSKSQLKKSRDTGRSVNLMETDDWLVVVPLDKDASCFHGKNSDWCTTKREHGYYENYFYDKNIILIYCLNKKTGGMWAIANYRHVDLPDPDDEDAEDSEYDLSALEANSWAEYFDQKDTSLTQSQFNQQTGLDSEHLLNLSDKLMRRDQPVQQRLDQRTKQLRTAKDTLARGAKQRDLDLERELIDLGDSASAFEYLRNMGKAGVDAGTLPIKLQYLAARHNVRESVLPWFKKPDARILDISIKNQSESLGYAIDNDLLTPKIVNELGPGRVNADLIKKLIDKDLFTKELRDRLANTTYGIYALHRAGQKVSQDEIEHSIISRDQYSQGIIFWDTVMAMLEFNFVPSDKFFQSGAEVSKTTANAFQAGVIKKLGEKVQEYRDSVQSSDSRTTTAQGQIEEYQAMVDKFQEEMNNLNSLERLTYQQQDRVKKLQYDINFYNNFINDLKNNIAQYQEHKQSNLDRLETARNLYDQLADNL